MISRHRLRGRRRFAAVRASGLRASSSGVRVQLAGNGLAVARVGYALMGMRSAVARNLLRRRLREAMRPHLPALGGHDVVLVAGAQAADLAFAELCEAVSTATGRALQRSATSPAASTADNGPVSASRVPHP